VTSPTYSFSNDKFKYSHEIIVIKTKTRKQVLIALPVSGLLCNIVKNIIIDAETACSMI
jgi:hypothetical protein